MLEQVRAQSQTTLVSESRWSEVAVDGNERKCDLGADEEVVVGVNRAKHAHLQLPVALSRRRADRMHFDEVARAREVANDLGLVGI